MPSYRGCAIQVDLRGIPNGDRFDLAPIAIVRLMLDEADAVTFQCLPSGLLALSRYLKQAADSIARLESQVSPTGPASK